LEKRKNRKMAKMRKPFQGVWNIVRFNWHFYVLAFGFLLVLVVLANCLVPFSIYFWTIGLLVLIPTVVSLFVSYYVYDVSELYKLNWLHDFNADQEATIVNINAGFDETSGLIDNKFPKAKLVVLDFYDPKTHTEISIKRARNAYPQFPNTVQVTTSKIPLETNSADLITVLFSAHEIRNEQERIVFFKELNRILQPEGQIIITEHLRDFANFCAYTIGFLHFYSKKTWHKTFHTAGFKIVKEQKITPFISTFILIKNGITA
jgi:ubiquinone/menaquinone biosynthesis C-methylase UbiE